MSLRVGAYATIWEARNNNGTVSVNLSTSRKDKSTGNYVTDWSGWMRVYADQDAMLQLPRKTRIVIDEFSVSNRYDKEAHQTNTYYSLFKYHLLDTPPRDDTSVAAASVSTDEDLPF